MSPGSLPPTTVGVRTTAKAALEFVRRTPPLPIDAVLVKLHARDRAQLVMPAYEAGVVIPGMPEPDAGEHATGLPDCPSPDQPPRGQCQLNLQTDSVVKWRLAGPR